MNHMIPSWILDHLEKRKRIKPFSILATNRIVSPLGKISPSESPLRWKNLSVLSTKSPVREVINPYTRKQRNVSKYYHLDHLVLRNDEVKNKTISLASKSKSISPGERKKNEIFIQKSENVSFESSDFVVFDTCKPVPILKEKFRQILPPIKKRIRKPREIIKFESSGIQCESPNLDIANNNIQSKITLTKKDRLSETINDPKIKNQDNSIDKNSTHYSVSGWRQAEETDHNT